MLYIHIVCIYYRYTHICAISVLCWGNVVCARAAREQFVSILFAKGV